MNVESQNKNMRKSKRNSTIKQEEQHNNRHELQNQSSISIHQQTDVHYYDLDYSDEQSNNDIVSSSDEQVREILHDEFIDMIHTNQIKKIKQKKQEQLNYPSNFRNTHQRQVRSNDYKQIYNKRVTPSTRDKSYNFYRLQSKNEVKQQKNDPEKQSNDRKQVKFQKKEHSNYENSVQQFRIDSFLNYTSQSKKAKQKSRKIFKETNQPNQNQNQNQSEFSLITLPEYQDQSSSCLPQMGQGKDQRQVQHKKAIHYRLKSKKSAFQQDQGFEKVNWRYQQAKLKFMDNFMPDSLKIGNNPYNMLKYISRKTDLNFKILTMM